MPLVNETNITVDGIDYEVEHSEDGSLERVVLWANPTFLVADAIINHNVECITVHFHNGEEKRTETYDYWAFANEDSKDVAVAHLAIWMGSVA